MRNQIIMSVFLLGIITGALGCATKSTQPETYHGLGKDSISPEIIEKYAPTTQSPALMRKIQSYLDLRSTGLGLMTEDGKNFFYTWSITGSNQVWKLTEPLHYPTQLTGGEDPTLIADLTPDGKYLILQRDRKGEENPGLYLQPTSGGALIEIQHLTGAQTKFEWTSSNSKYIYYSSNDKKNDQYTIYKYAIDSHAKIEILNQPGLWFVADQSKDGTFLLGKQKGALQTEYYLFDEPTQKLTPVLGQNENEEYTVQFGRTKEELLVLTNKFGEFRRLYKFIRNQFYALTPEINFDVSDFYIDRPRLKIFVTINHGGYSKLHVYHSDSFKEFTLPEFKGAEHTVGRWTSRNGRFTTIGVETAHSPRQNYVLDWSAKPPKVTAWTKPNAPEVNTITFAPETLERYTARDGSSIPMFVNRPSRCRTEVCPVIVYFHGGPESQSTPGFSPFIQLFIDEGYIFVQPNVRGSDGYGKTWLHSDDGVKRLQVITDIEDAAFYIKKNWSKNGVTPKIGVMGGSYGGYSTLYAMTKFAGAYDAGVASVGMSSLLTFLQNTAPYRRILRINEYGDPEKDADALKELSPITYASKISAPLLIIQGVSDPRVPVGEALQFYEKIQSKNSDSKLILFSNEGHGSAQRNNRAIEIENTIDFFNKYLRSVTLLKN